MFAMLTRYCVNFLMSAKEYNKVMNSLTKLCFRFKYILQNNVASVWSISLRSCIKLEIVESCISSKIVLFSSSPRAQECVLV